MEIYFKENQKLLYITMEELKKGLKKLKLDHDRLTAEMLKYIGEKGILLLSLNEIMRENMIPEDWELAVILL